MKNNLCLIVCAVCLSVSGVWLVSARVLGDEGAVSSVPKTKTTQETTQETIQEGDGAPAFVWMHDLKKARAIAKAESKPLFVMFRCEP